MYPSYFSMAQPGGIVTPRLVRWCQDSLKNLETVDLGEGIHYLQEGSSPRDRRACSALVPGHDADWRLTERSALCFYGQRFSTFSNCLRRVPRMVRPVGV